MNIVAKTETFQKGLAKAGSLLKGFADKATSTTGVIASLAGGAGIGALLHQFDELGSSLHDISTMTGVTVENLSKWKYAAEQSGAGIDALTRAFKFMQKNGVDPNTFNQVAAAIASIKDPTERAQAALKAFGKSGTSLLPMIMELPQLSAELEKLGGVVTTEMANNADALGDSWGKLKTSLTGVANTVANAIAPTVTKLNEWLSENGPAITKWIGEHQQLVTALGATAAGLAVFGSALAAISAAINPVTIALAGLAAVLYNVAQAYNTATDAQASFFDKALAVANVAAPVVGAGRAAYDYATGGSQPSGGGKQTTNKGVEDQLKTANSFLRMMAGEPPIKLEKAGVR